MGYFCGGEQGEKAKHYLSKARRRQGGGKNCPGGLKDENAMEKSGVREAMEGEKGGRERPVTRRPWHVTGKGGGNDELQYMVIRGKWLQAGGLSGSKEIAHLHD